MTRVCLAIYNEEEILDAILGQLTLEARIIDWFCGLFHFDVLVMGCGYWGFGTTRQTFPQVVTGRMSEDANRNSCWYT